ncbi:Aste57867_21481 [Aphanomyces stellatus]|uniref:Aste57867_21481 protein n=1 Tax=Aphanomyces stellatus TaxID=120398 RepID=A0A485LIX4_9STRA|nr:hypothetical protein As57867_021412 [Aphanomyces stellatus]VFT98151.1 Aste57867_21481 [Aphanomyces stellatus]
MDDDVPPIQPKRSVIHHIVNAVGLAYAVTSVVFGFCSLYIMAQYAENNLFWPTYLSADIEAVLTNVINAKLAGTTQHTVTSLNVATAHVVDRRVGLETSPTYARSRLYSDELAAIGPAIASLRQVAIEDVALLSTPYCWLDLQRRWQVAVSDARQRRCDAAERENGAVVVEAIFRNIPLAAWMTIYGNTFMSSIGHVLTRSPEGRLWLDAMDQHSWPTVADEVAVWAQHNLTTFRLQWGNRHAVGVHEIMTIENALGVSSVVHIKNVPSTGGGLVWTSATMFESFSSLMVAIPFGSNQSLVRNDATWIGMTSPHWVELDITGGAPLGVVPQAVHDSLGPLGSIDLKFQSVPSALLDAVDAFHTAFLGLLRTNTKFASHIAGHPPQTIFPTPRRWQNPALVFAGGNPLCALSISTDYIQPSFGFDDECVSVNSRPFGLTWSMETSLFAAAFVDETAWGNVPQLCQRSSNCDVLYNVPFRELASWLQTTVPIDTATVQAALAPLHLAFIQFIFAHDGSVILDTQFLIDDTSDPSWSVVGWMSIFEWAQGSREVVSFQGDMDSRTIVSTAYAPQVVLNGNSDVGLSIAKYLWWVAAYTSACLSTAVVFLLRAFYHHRNDTLTNWFTLNRVAGSAWAGRLILTVRGVLATVCLSTAPVGVVQDDSYAYLTYSPRPRWVTMALAGESLWLTYTLQELLCQTTFPNTQAHAHWGSLLAWLALVVVDTFVPPSFDTAIHRTCSAQGVDNLIVCSSATVVIGHYSRLLRLSSIHVASTLSTMALVYVWRRTKAKGMSPSIACPTLLLPGSALSFMYTQPSPLGYWTLDYTSLAMSGIVNFNLGQANFILDINLWVLMQTDHFEFIRCDACMRFPHAFERVVVVNRSVFGDTSHSWYRSGSRGSLAPTLRTLKAQLSQKMSFRRRSTVQVTKAPTRLTLAAIPHVHPVTKPRRRYWRYLWQYGVVAYALATLVGNVLYATVTARSIFYNDFFWVDFSAAGTQAFLGNLLNGVLVAAQKSSLVLDSASCAALTPSNNATTPSIAFSDVLARRVLHTPMGLDAVIANLRSMNPCAMPYMFTQYCWVDFGLVWEMAPTAARQTRCALDRTNGAVYLEAILRNLRNWDEWDACWGTSFGFGIAKPLKSRSDGKAWLEQTRALAPPVAEEAQYWRANAITQFSLQWQNYKRLGMTNVFRMQNAVGMQFPLTLSVTTGAFQMDVQSSMKMYWNFASDLWAVAANTTSVSQRSLIRGSPNFAFANTTREALLVYNESLESPFTSGFAVLATTLGPFGAVDMKYVPCPTELTQLYASFMAAVVGLLFSNALAQSTFLAIAHKSYIMVTPPPLLLNPTIVSLGGNLLCGSDVPPSTQTFYGGFAVSRPCHSDAIEYLVPDSYEVLFAMLGYGAATSSNLNPDVIDAWCAMDGFADTTCATTYQQSALFLRAYNSTFGPLHAAAVRASRSTSVLPVSLVQFILNGTEPMMFQQLLLDASTRSWPFMGWCYLYEWAAGLREVVSFQGDVGSITTISAYYTPLTFVPNPSEVPSDLALVLRTCILYITALFLVHTVFVLVYAIVSRGHIEYANVFRISRLVGLVWAGRPFLFVRSMSAMIYLNTSSLALTQRGAMTGLVPPHVAWFNLLLASLELQWFVYVLNDAFSCVTQHFTSFYAGKSAWAASIVVWIWMQERPNSATAALDRTCTAIDMDLELTCDSGVLEIGRVSYLFVSMAICFSSVAVCYVVEKYIRQSGSTLDIPSLLLSSQAKYMLDFATWSCCGTYYIDKATALMAGIVSAEWKGVIYLFDVKKWRFFVVPRPDLEASVEEKFKHAIPILE